jgi:hypothetical protein
MGVDEERRQAGGLRRLKAVWAKSETSARQWGWSEASGRVAAEKQRGQLALAP